MFKNRGKHIRIPRYPTGPLFLNPLIYWAVVDVVTDSLIGPVNSLIAQKNSLLTVQKFPVSFTGIFWSRVRKPMVRRELSG